MNNDIAVDIISRKDTKIIERQGFILPALGVPFIAAALPAAGAAAIGIYGSYGDEITSLFNSFFSKSSNKTFKPYKNRLDILHFIYNIYYLPQYFRSLFQFGLCKQYRHLCGWSLSVW